MNRKVMMKHKFEKQDLEIIELALNEMIDQYALLDRSANQRLTNNINEAKLTLEKVRSV